MTELIDSPFASSEVTTTDTSASRALQSRGVAETQTKYLMAQQFPRDERGAMDRIINAFSRPGLAEHAAYEYGKGGSKISGPTIHAAQAIAQQWGNVEFGFCELNRNTDADGVTCSQVEAFAMDLQARTRRVITFLVRHWRDTKQGGYRIREEREIYELMANMAQRRTRACILALLPQDVIDAAMQQAELTLKTRADTSPEAMAKMVEAFGAFGVGKEQIEKLIQRRLDAISPAQVVRLKRIYASLRDEMSSPAEWFDLPEPAPASSQIEAVRDVLKTKGKTVPPPPAPPAKSYARFVDEVNSATDLEIAALILDEARSTLPPDQLDELNAVYRRKWQPERSST